MKALGKLTVRLNFFAKNIVMLRCCCYCTSDCDLLYRAANNGLSRSLNAAMTKIREGRGNTAGREKDAIAARGKTRKRALYKYLPSKKLRSGNERGVARGTRRERERERGRKKGQRLTSTFSCVCSVGAMFVLGNAITLSYKI